MRDSGVFEATDIVLAVMLVAAVAVLFAPWLVSGSSHRTSFEVLRSADRLDVVPGSADTVVRVLWSFVPFAAALSAVALVLERRRLAAALALVVGVTVTLLAGLVQSAPRSAEWGVGAALVVGPLLVIVALATAWRTRKAT